MDVVGIGYDEYTPEQRDQVIAAFPRGDFKSEFIQVQTCSSLKKPQTTFGTVNVETLPGLAEPSWALVYLNSESAIAAAFTQLVTAVGVCRFLVRGLDA